MKKSFLIITTILIIIIILALIINYFLNNNSNNEHLEKINEFKISKIHYYSGVNAENNRITYQNPEWDLNIYQYTDIAIFLERINNISENNYIKQLYIDSIDYEASKLGEQELYYLKPMDFGKSDFNDENKIDDKFEYKVVNAQNKDNDMPYNMPIYFEDCSNPLTLKYVNRNIVKNYIVDSKSTLIHNGNLLKKAGVSINQIKCKLKFNLNVVTQNRRKTFFAINFKYSITK